MVKWKGYPSEENTWEKKGNLLPGAREALEEFERYQLEDAKVEVSAVSLVEPQRTEAESVGENVTGQPSGAAPCKLPTVGLETNIMGNILHARGSPLFGATDCPQHGVGSVLSQLSAQRRDLGNHRRSYAEALSGSR